jgi:hypothetical protein
VSEEAGGPYNTIMFSLSTRKGTKPLYHLIDSWTIFDNSKDIPRLIAFKESEELHIIDSEVYGKLSKGEIP